MPDDTAAVIDTDAWQIPPIFTYIEKCGNIDRKEMFSTYNMGIGMMMVVDADDAAGVVEALKAVGENAAVIGEIRQRTDDSVVLSHNE